MIVNRPRVVAEIGTAHRGDLQRARELVHAAKEAGADTAKFQLVRAEEILHSRAGMVTLPAGRVPLFERFRELERDEDFFAQLMEICDDAGIRFLCTPFGIESARTLKRLGVGEIKIASPELNHIPLLKEVATYRKPLILSAGVATLTDIAEAVTVIGGAVPVTVLHCITAYPAPEEEYNLRVIPSLSSVLGLPVGISDHSLDPILVPTLATLLGATIIEKHITLRRSDSGLDDAIALEPQDFKTMVAQVRETAEALDEAARQGPVELRQAELALEERLRHRFDPSRVANVLGTGIKGLAPSEQRNYGYTNRSIHALTEIKRGETLSPHNTAVLRTEHNLRPGLHPRFWDTIIGSRVARTVAAGDGIRWTDLLDRG
jgi:N-acetylneuraminate synthase